VRRRVFARGTIAAEGCARVPLHDGFVHLGITFEDVSSEQAVELLRTPLASCRPPWSSPSESWLENGGRPVATVPPMEDRPTAAELLEAVSRALDDEVLPLTDPAVQHKVRVAANLCRIVERELRLGPPAAARERAALADLLGRDGTLPELNAALSTHLRTAEAAFLPGALDVLLDAVEDKLAVDKPGYTMEDVS
jgi:hypothetical protein